MPTVKDAGETFLKSRALRCRYTSAFARGADTLTAWLDGLDGGSQDGPKAAG
jgi:hypothetical protein